MKKVLSIVLILIIVAFGGFMFLHKKSAGSLNNSSAAQSQQTAASTAKQQNNSTTSFDKTKYSLTDPTSIWVIVNKRHPLKPQDYIPPDLVTPDLPLRVPGNESMQMRKVTADALTKLFEAASADGTPLMVSSAYRSYSYQVSLYGKYVKEQGQAVADTQSARPGYSEHQTGLSVDVEPKDQKCDVDQCFGDTPAGKWIAANSYKYGFIIRYPLGKDKVTGYEYEPWHIRYIGVDAATEMHNQHIDTLEDFFGLPAAPDYQ